MKHLVVFYAESGVYSMVYDFKNVPPAIKDIQEMQNDLQRQENMRNAPAVVNWLPISE